jgi:hypothetical protein
MKILAALLALLALACPSEEVSFPSEPPRKADLTIPLEKLNAAFKVTHLA